MTKQLVQSAIWAAVIAINALVVLGCGSTTSADELGTQEQPLLLGQTWTLTVLEPMTTELRTDAFDMNARGVVVGQAGLVSQAATWSRRGELTLLPWGDGAAYGINASGDVVGWAEHDDGYDHVAKWEKGSMIDLGAYDVPGEEVGVISTHGKAISNGGLIVAATEGNSRSRQLVLVRQNGDWVSIGDFGEGGTKVLGRQCVNSSGMIVGRSLNAAEEQRAFLWDGTLHELGTLGGSTSFAVAINEPGWVVGSSTVVGDTDSHGFLWDGTTMHDLNAYVTLPEGTRITAARFIANNGTMIVTLWTDGEGMFAGVMRPDELP